MTRLLSAEAGVERAGRRQWLGLAVLALPALLASLELTVTHLALPAIGADLAATSTELLWIVDVYAFLLAGSLITMGAWGDRIGRRRLLLIGATGYGIASVAAAYAPNAELLIGARALMGIAGSTLMPATLSLVTVMFTEARQRATAIGIVVASVAGGTAIGPLVGGWLLERFWWGSVFLLGVPMMLILLMAGPVLLPERRDGAPGRLDLLSALLSLTAVLPVVYGLKRIAAEGAEPVALLAIVAGIGIAVGFVQRQRGRAEPFVDLRLFASRQLSAAAAALALGIFVLWGSNYAIAQQLQLVHGLSPLSAGLWTAPSAIGVIVGSTLAPRIARTIRPATVIAAGLAVSAVGYVVLTQVGTDGIATLVAGAVIVSAGLGPMMALATDMVVASAPPQRAGAAAAISATAPQLGGALGIAVLGSIITAVYRTDVTTAALADVPADATAAARNNLNAALAASQHLPQPAAGQLLDTARDAFTNGLQYAAAISTVLMVATAAFVLTTNRRRNHRPERVPG